MTRTIPALAALALIVAPTAHAQEDAAPAGSTDAGVGRRARTRGVDEEDAAPASTSESAQVKKLLEKYKTEPTVRDVQEAAGRYAEVHPEVLQSWRSRARKAAAAPQFRAEYRQVTSADNRQVEAGGSGSNSITTNNTLEHRPLVRAQWDLDRLVFNPDELRVANQTVDLVRLRESVMDQVTKLYFERRRLQVENDLAPAADIAGKVRKELRLQELVADIDGLTGGFFSKKLAEAGVR